MNMPIPPGFQSPPVIAALKQFSPPEVEDGCHRVMHEIDEGKFLFVDWAENEDDGFYIHGVYAGNVELFNSSMLSQWAAASCEQAALADANKCFRRTTA